MRTIIITGLSGAGKSNAVKYLEDIGYYCIDNSSESETLWNNCTQK